MPLYWLAMSSTSDGSVVHMDTDGITSDEILSRLEAIAAKRE